MQGSVTFLSKPQIPADGYNTPHVGALWFSLFTLLLWSTIWMCLATWTHFLYGFTTYDSLILFHLTQEYYYHFVIHLWFSINMKKEELSQLLWLSYAYRIRKPQWSLYAYLYDTTRENYTIFWTKQRWKLNVIIL